VFVYGTLRSGQSAHYLIEGRTYHEVLTRMPLVDMYMKSGTSYPYAVPNSRNTTGIVGENMFIKPELYDDTMARLDRYERYDPAKPVNDMEYVRTQMRTREGVSSWIYVTSPRISEYLRTYGTFISSGDYLRRW
jgi:gamma-glutamylcyclotransferase (GGCT)/AIG2-like uncharacterized protein YtfP